MTPSGVSNCSKVPSHRPRILNGSTWVLMSFLSLWTRQLNKWRAATQRNIFEGKIYRKFFLSVTYKGTQIFFIFWNETPNRVLVTRLFQPRGEKNLEKKNVKRVRGIIWEKIGNRRRWSRAISYCRNNARPRYPASSFYARWRRDATCNHVVTVYSGTKRRGEADIKSTGCKIAPRWRVII